MTGVTYCSVAEIFDDPEFAGLVAENARECAEPELTPAAPDRAFYLTLEENCATDCYRCVVDGRMCGYAFVLMSPSGHNGKKYATVESIFVSTEGRERGVGSELMECMIATARLADCEAFFIVAHVGTQLAKFLFLLPELYRNTGHVFCRRLR